MLVIHHLHLLLVPDVLPLIGVQQVALADVLQELLVGRNIEKIIRNHHVGLSSFKKEVVSDLRGCGLAELDLDAIILGHMNHLLLKAYIHMLKVKVYNGFRLNFEFVQIKILPSSFNSPV